MRLKKTYYTTDELSAKLHYYAGLSEKQQRHFLGIEYISLGRGSKSYLCEVYKCSHHRVALGQTEIQLLQANSEPADYTRQRKVGGGAKKKR